MTESTTQRRELLRLLELDYERTSKFIEGILSTGVTIRGWAITISLALLGVGFDRHLWQAAVLAIAVTLMFGFLDAYHSWLYSEALLHSRSIEAVLARYYASLVRGDVDEDANEDFEVKLEAHPFGLSANLSRFTASSIVQLRPRVVLLGIYGSLLAIALAAAGLIAFVDP